MAGRVPARLSALEGRKFALTVGAAFLVLGGVIQWRSGFSSRIAMMLLAVGVILVVAGVAIPGRLGPVYKLWMGLAAAISRVTTPIFMGIVYFVVITPTGLLMRLFGKRPLVHRAESGSYFVARSHGGKSDMNRQF